MPRSIHHLLAASLLAVPTGGVMGGGAALAQASAASEQQEARKEMRAGNVLSLREIERRVLPSMRGSEYLGPAYDDVAMAYRLKFIRNGRVSFVDVDARTGRVLRRSR